MRLHHVQLAIPPGAEDLCRRFYCGVLGWDELPKPGNLVERGGLWLRAGEDELHLGVEIGFRPARKAHPAFVVDDLEALAVRLAAAGALVEWDEAIPDMRRFYTADAVGNRLEFIQDAKDGRGSATP